MDIIFRIFTMSRLIKMAICIAGGIVLNMHMQIPLFMVVGFAMFLLVGFDILKDKQVHVAIRFGICTIMILMFAYLIQTEYGIGDEFKYFTSFTGGCLAWFLGTSIFKRFRNIRQGA